VKEDLVMRFHRELLLGMALALPFVRPSVAGAAGRPPADREVVARSDAFLKAMLSADPAAVAAIYRDDAILMPACAPQLQGRTAIEGYYRELFGGPVKITAFTFDHTEARVHGDVAYDVGTYRQTLTGVPGGSMDDTGKYVVILKRTGGEWQVAYAIHNSDVPAPPPASAASR
jgi:uncharacterized protein (TIGR02246 family)